MKNYCRHDMLLISRQGRARIFETILKEHPEMPVNLAEDLVLHKFSKGEIPGIVRRSDTVLINAWSVGFAHPVLLNGNRVRISADVKTDEIIDLITPYELPYLSYETRNRTMLAFRDATALEVCKTGRMGVIGSVGMEIITGARYTNDNSDIDLLIKGCTYNEITKIFTTLTQIGMSHNVEFDIEIELNNGYGIKAVELFIGSHTLLGKSLTDIKLLERNTVFDFLKF